MVFRDIRPAADHHYLVVTKQHIKDPKHLKEDDLELCKIIQYIQPSSNFVWYSDTVKEFEISIYTGDKACSVDIDSNKPAVQFMEYMKSIEWF